MNIVHGGDIFRIANQRRWDWRDVLDFSANINPLGPAPGVHDAIRLAIDRIRCYPSPESVALSALLSRQWSVPATQFLCDDGDRTPLYSPKVLYAGGPDTAKLRLLR